MIATPERVGPLHRSTLACYDCGAPPGQRHTMVCDLSPHNWELAYEFGPEGESPWAPWVETCCWCGEPGNTEQGPVKASIAAPPVSGYTATVEPYHADCLASASRAMVL